MTLYRIALLYVVVALVVSLSLVGNGVEHQVIYAHGGAAVVPTPQPTPTLNSDTFPPPYARAIIKANGQMGYLWYKEDPARDVFIIGMNYNEYPNTFEQADKWVSEGQGCYASAGSMYTMNSKYPKNDFGIGIKLLDKNCVGFEGWVHYSALNFKWLKPIFVTPTPNQEG